MIKKVSEILRKKSKESSKGFIDVIGDDPKLNSIADALSDIFNKEDISEGKKEILFTEIKKRIDNFEFKKERYERVIEREMDAELLKAFVITCERVSSEVFVDESLTHIVFLGSNGKSISFKKEDDEDFSKRPEMWAFKYINLYEPFIKWFSIEDNELKDSKFFWFSIEEILEDNLIFENK